MTFEQITTLLDKGFTPEQITLLTTSAVPTAADPVDSGEPANPLADSPDETIQPEPDPEPVPAAPPTPSPAAAADNSEILNAIADLKKSVQAANIKTMSMDSVNADNQLEKAMAELIRPSFEKGE